MVAVLPEQAWAAEAAAAAVRDGEARVVATREGGESGGDMGGGGGGVSGGAQPLVVELEGPRLLM